MIKENTCDIRLVSVWHGPETICTIHFSLYNNGPATLVDFSLCLTGTLWLTEQSRVLGGRLVRTVSNFVQIRPDCAELEAGGVWTFSLSGLNNWPRHAGDGPQSAYLAFDDGRFANVGVQPLSRSKHIEELDGAEPATAAAAATPVAASMTISVIPFPNVASIAIAPLCEGIPALRADEHMPAALLEQCHRVTALAERVVPGDWAIFAKPGEKGLRQLHLHIVKDARLGFEGYKVLFDEGDIHIEAETETGLFYGLVTLFQMVVGARRNPQQFGFPVRGTLNDIPRFSWRAVLVDVARTFYPPRELKAIADLLAWHKLNVLHLHLNDDEAWRIDVDGYPQVAEHCAWRGHGLKIPPLLGSSFEPYGGVYTPADIATLEDHARSLSMTLVPEIDVPGHAHALIETMPELHEAEDTGGYNSIQGFFSNALNPCLPQSYSFLDAAFGTVMRMFGGQFVHIGGDEVGPATWTGSPLARKMADERRLPATNALQSDIITFVEQRVKRERRTVITWEDALDNASLDPKSTITVAWQHPDRAHELAHRGYDVILAPGNAYYLDMASEQDWQASGGYWAGVVPLQRTYDFEADLGWPKALLPKLRGVQACIWGEYMYDRRNFDALVFPRIFAFAERAWIDRTSKDFSGFLTRAMASTARVDREGTQP